MEIPLERPFETIAAVTNKKDFWKLAVRVKDKWTVVKDGKEHLEMIIVDAKGNNIQVVIPTGYKAVYDKILMENTTYTLSNFQVQNNDLAFKASDHKYMLKWNSATNVVDVNLHDIPIPNTKFKPFAEIISGKWRSDLLVHVIGMVQDMGYCQLNEGNGKKLQDYAARFIQYNKDRKDVGPLIIMLNYCKIKEEGRYPLSVSNTYSFTKMFLNDNIPEINLFRESLPKDEQLVSSSQILCTQSYTGSQVATQDDLLSKNTVLPLSQVIQLDQITYCVTVATIQKVNSNKNGWYYFACHKCPKIAKGDKPPYTCEDGHNTEIEIVRYKLEMDVSYESDRCNFVVWDREVTQMLGISAAQLRSNMIQVQFKLIIYRYLNTLLFFLLHRSM
ncbi:putative nucleic acid-binding protein [Medicago truncatula]|uniref:Putative nucleic acid-binding protein n=1 Tax=Medicago truncatula TaxID=3880 RepID=A0A396J9J6_MEDTR|nr:putative nucleic acid-binding protein [Medicago truncatula]